MTIVVDLLGHARIGILHLIFEVFVIHLEMDDVVKMCSQCEVFRFGVSLYWVNIG